MSRIVNQIRSNLIRMQLKGILGSIGAIVVALGPTSSASASEVAMFPGGMNVNALPGETNNVAVDWVVGGGPFGETVFTVDDLAGTTTTDFADCYQDHPSLGQVSCIDPGGTLLNSVSLGGGDDVAVVIYGVDDLVTVVVGGGGDDVVRGSGGRDFLVGRGGDDKLLGRAGDDKLQGDRGADKLKGGDGNDRLKARDDRRDRRINCGDGSDRRAKYDRGLDPGPISCND